MIKECAIKEDKLIDECTETVEEVKPAIITHVENENENSYKCSSCIMYTLFWIFFTVNIGAIGAYFVYFYWYLKKDLPHVDFKRFTKHMNGKYQTN